MADREQVEESLGAVWRATARRIAVAAGAGMALVALVLHLPLWVAALRGALVLCAVLAVARATHAALTRVLEAEQVRTGRREEART